jgi:hypothetical protein
VPSYGGLSITFSAGGRRVTLTALEENVEPADIRSSLRMSLPPGVPDATDPAAATSLILLAATPGAFVDLAADLRWLTTVGSSRGPGGLALDENLPVPQDPAAPSGLTMLSTINQAKVMRAESCRGGKQSTEAFLAVLSATVPGFGHAVRRRSSASARDGGIRGDCIGRSSDGGANLSSISVPTRVRGRMNRHFSLSCAIQTRRLSRATVAIHASGIGGIGGPGVGSDQAGSRGRRGQGRPARSDQQPAVVTRARAGGIVDLDLPAAGTGLPGVPGSSVAGAVVAAEHGCRRGSRGC